MSSETDNLNSIKDLVRWGASEFNRHDIFFGHGTDNALDEALSLVLHCLHLDHSLPAEYLTSQVSLSEKEKILSMIQERINSRKPLAYLTNTAHFAGMTFFVNEHVLVPRSPIAELIEDGFQPWIDPDSLEQVLDLCCGSGCIGIACAEYLPHINVTLADISDEALEIAQRNIHGHHLDDRVEAIKSDLYENLGQAKYELIISNPPYVSQEEYDGLPLEYHREPQIGLTAGADGMDIVSRILQEATDHLTENGMLILEVGASAELLLQRYPNVPFTWVEFERGGDGVFILTRQELLDHEKDFQEN